jgi:hypothetical protein
MEATMRRLLLSHTLALTLSAVGAGSALAEAPEGAQKAPIYGPLPFFSCATGGTPTPETFGFLVLNTPGDETTITGEVALKHAAPNTTYQVNFTQGACLFDDTLGTITTNTNGTANAHFAFARDPAATTGWVEMFRVGGGEDLASPQTEVD